jgi:predicted patatin/cPLA2 family phospholipase
MMRYAHVIVLLEVCIMSRALVLGPGGLRGVYSGGIVATLGRRLGRSYFRALYCCSAGSYTGSYFASGQPDMIEGIWRECVHDNLLIRWRNIFRPGQPVLDLFYLNNVLRSERYRLNVEDLLCSSVKMTMVATDCQSGEARYFSPKTSEEFFLQVRASAAAPHFHPKVLIEGRKYADGHLSDPYPVEKALADGHDEVIVVCNQSRLSVGNLLEANSQRVRAIFPSVKSPVRWNFDSSYARINQLVDLGIADALTFIA